MEIGDEVRITLVDREILEGKLIACERGFYIIIDTQGNKSVCRESSVARKEVIK